MNRLATGREPRWDICAAIGREAEENVIDIAEGLRDGSVEVKCDLRARRTGRIYIEMECLRMGIWRPSGLQTTQAEVWAHMVGGTHVMVVLPVLVLRSLVDVHGKAAKEEDGSHPTKGFTLDLRMLLWWAMQEAEKAA